MEISGKTQQYLLRARQPFIGREDRPQHAGAGETPGAGHHDDVALSPRGSMIRSAMQAVHHLPDVRAAKVDAIRQMLASGTYRFEGERIAGGLMAESEENNEILDHCDAGRSPETEDE